MERIRIGIICPSEIALRRFLPALCKRADFHYVGVAVANINEWGGATSSIIEKEKEKAQNFSEQFGGKVFESYYSLITSDMVDAVYIPLPPALHYKWTKFALENGKHVFLEKPSTTTYDDTKALINLAEEKELALHENYMFQYHNQISFIKVIIDENRIGHIRLFDAKFGFPKREGNDFRYNKELGGGALLDCGGYPVKLMSILMGDKIKVDTAKLVVIENGIDLYGSVLLSSKEQVAQISFGMDNSYKCELEIWGSEGTVYTNRIFTAPNNYKVEIQVKKGNSIESIELGEDDAFEKSLEFFKECVEYRDVRMKEYKDILKQMQLIEDIREMGSN